MDNITIFGQADKHLRRSVELLQKNNVRVVIHDEQEFNAICIREEKRRAEAIVAEKLQANRMGKEKQKATGADKQKDNALVELRQRRNGGVVIRDELELRICQGDLIHHRNGVVICDELEIRICEEKRRVDAIDVEKLKGTSIGKGKQNAPYANRGQENSMVDLLHHRNGVVIRDDLEICICEKKRRADAIDVEKLKRTFVGKGKQNAPYANRGQENSTALNDNVIFKATLAQ
ncbi:uncharacterized protein LOC131329562 [Rhododendron vialii]|uniref:uncharacterized protein LOC131329562 n=1 Tax=Rhododendron vialii TaxID=182163 RepID=UPI00265F4BBE|nr:uncharacterized protein LOC131329562 [Rhododendron vialii]